MTLGELRELVELTRSLPADTVPHVKTRATWSAHGARVTRIVLVAPAGS